MRDKNVALLCDKEVTYFERQKICHFEDKQVTHVEGQQLFMVAFCVTSRLPLLRDNKDSIFCKRQTGWPC